MSPSLRGRAALPQRGLTALVSCQTDYDAHNERVAFTAKTERIASLAQTFAGRIAELKEIFEAPTYVYSDYANVRPWADRLRWHVDLKRLKQLLDSFDTVRAVKLYQGTLVGDRDSETLIRDVSTAGYEVITKPVKIMRHSIDVSSVAPDSSDILKSFVRTPLLRQLKLEAVAYLNDRLRELNRAGTLWLEDRKCNFDVEIGRDLLRDFDQRRADTFVLWSGDSDFAGPVEELLANGKRVYLFATARRVSTELSALRARGLVVFDIQKIREFICWPREMRIA